MDIGINKPFKHAIKNQYSMWFDENTNEENRKPGRQNGAICIAAAWLQTQERSIETTQRQAFWKIKNITTKPKTTTMKKVKTLWMV
jgi:hypothetical protein